MNPEYYIIYPDDVTDGPFPTAEEARANVDEYQLKRNLEGVKIARTIAVSATKATFEVSWNKPYALVEAIGASDFIHPTQVVK